MQNVIAQLRGIISNLQEGVSDIALRDDYNAFENVSDIIVAAKDDISDAISDLEKIEQKHTEKVEDLELKDDSLFEPSHTITCQSGGQLYMALGKESSLKHEQILDSLKGYLEAGRNENALIDFLND